MTINENITEKKLIEMANTYYRDRMEAEEQMDKMRRRQHRP